LARPNQLLEHLSSLAQHQAHNAVADLTRWAADPPARLRSITSVTCRAAAAAELLQHRR
jgi:hypothetical protein